jgi:hypothetical protein
MSDTLIAGSQASLTSGQTSADGTNQATQQAAASADGQTQGQQQSATSAATTQSNATSGSAQQTQTQNQAYELKVPEGANLDASYLEQTKALAKELGLSQEAAQKLVERDAGLMSSVSERNTAQVREKTEQWAKDAEADKEIGGSNFQSSVTDARTALDKFGTPEFKNLLNQSGVGNHPELIRLLARVGKAMREDKMVTSSSQPARDQKSFADAFYPSMANKSE